MEKHIHLFSTQAEFETAYNGSEYKEPWLSYVEGKGIDYNKFDPFNGHEYVDLGLPSGTLWATCNIGAINPQDYGNYYSWGETETKSAYTVFNESVVGYDYDDGRRDLELSDDAARVNWGGDWRVPTPEELIELTEQTTTTWETLSGVNGRRFTGINGNSIFIPAAGYKEGTPTSKAGSFLGVWGSRVIENEYDGTSRASLLSSKDFFCSVDSYYRYYGYPIRPVIGS
jgi:hypothetical protein